MVGSPRCLYQEGVFAITSNRDEECFEPQNDDTGKIAEECHPSDTFEIPDEGYLFDAHSNDTGSTANDEKRTANAGAESQ